MSKLTHSTDEGMNAVELRRWYEDHGEKIVTVHVYPPIPTRKFDWCAHYDDPEGDVGYGETEQEAIRDLIDNSPRLPDPAVDNGQFGVGA